MSENVSEISLLNNKSTSIDDLLSVNEISINNIGETDTDNNSETSEVEANDIESDEENIINKFEGIGNWGTLGIDDDPWDNNQRPFVNLIKYDELELADEEKSGYLSQRIVASCSSYLDKCPVTRKYALCKCVLTQKVFLIYL